MSENEKKFLNDLGKLLASYAIDEVRCEERHGAKFIVVYSNSSFMAFRCFKDGTYYDIESRISEYIAQ